MCGLNALLTALLEKQIHFTFENIIIGLQSNNGNSKNAFVNFCILECKWQVWKHRIEVKYGKHAAKTDAAFFISV